MQGEQQETALGRGAWEPGVHLGPVEVKPEWGMPHGEGVQGHSTVEQLSQDLGDGTQAFQEQGKMPMVRTEGPGKLCSAVTPPAPSFRNPAQVNYLTCKV